MKQFSKGRFGDLEKDFEKDNVPIVRNTEKVNYAVKIGVIPDLPNIVVLQDSMGTGRTAERRRSGDNRGKSCPRPIKHAKLCWTCDAIEYRVVRRMVITVC